MKLSAYLKSRLPFILVEITEMAVLSAFLFTLGIGLGAIGLIALCWTLVSLTALGLSFFFRHKYLNRLMETAYALDKRYLLAEITEPPARPDDRVFYELLRLSGKSMLEQVSGAARERREYREYIENWIHEIKTPIAAIKLICDNHHFQQSERIAEEMEKIFCSVEQALYYARSETLEKDFLIRKFALCETVHTVLMENKAMLLRNRVHIEVDDCSQAVYADRKWLAYIIKQLTVNAVQYKAPSDARIIFSSQTVPEGVTLSIRDNGIGIPPEDLPRVFDKGFTGKNGRERNGATGIGLYLCRRLCEKMGMSIHAQAPPGGLTAFTILFPSDARAEPRD